MKMTTGKDKGQIKTYHVTKGELIPLLSTGAGAQSNVTPTKPGKRPAASPLPTPTTAKRLAVWDQLKKRDLQGFQDGAFVRRVVNNEEGM